MKLGQKVYVKELGKEAVVTSVNANGVAESVKIIDTGEVINTLNYTVQILTIVNTIVGVIKNIWKTIKGK